MFLTPNLVPFSAQTSFKPHCGSSWEGGPTPRIVLICRERDDARSPPDKVTQGTARQQKPFSGTAPQHPPGTRGHPAEGGAKLFCSMVPPRGARPLPREGAPTPPCRIFHRETGAGPSGSPPAPLRWEPARCEALPGGRCPPAAACYLPAGRRRSGGAPPGACRTAWLFRKVLPMARPDKRGRDGMGRAGMGWGRTGRDGPGSPPRPRRRPLAAAAPPSAPAPQRGAVAMETDAGEHRQRLVRPVAGSGWAQALRSRASPPSCRLWGVGETRAFRRRSGRGFPLRMNGSC